MDRWSWLLLLGGLVLGGVVVYLFLRPVSSSLASTPLYTYKAKPVMSNSEVWTWVDWRGRHRKITVTREVKTHGDSA